MYLVFGHKMFGLYSLKKQGNLIDLQETKKYTKTLYCEWNTYSCDYLLII